MEQKQGKHARLGIGEEEWSLEAEIDEQVLAEAGKRAMNGWNIENKQLYT